MISSFEFRRGITISLGVSKHRNYIVASILNSTKLVYNSHFIQYRNCRIVQQVLRTHTHTHAHITLIQSNWRRRNYTTI